MLTVAQLDERIEKCLAILADNPHSQVFAALADTYRKRGDFGRAFAVCKSGLKYHPDYAPAQIVMAKLFMHQSMFDEAQDAVQKAVTIDGRTRATDQLEAEILLGKKDLPGARAVVDRLRSTDPASPIIKELEVQIRRATGIQSRTITTGPIDVSGSHVIESAAKQHASPPVTITWDQWASELASRKGVRAVFAVALNEGGARPEAVCAEKVNNGFDDNAVAVCSAMFAAVDADLRARTKDCLSELRIECDGTEVWCRKSKGLLIGCCGAHGFSFGATRQLAIDRASQVGPHASEEK